MYITSTGMDNIYEVDLGENDFKLKSSSFANFLHIDCHSLFTSLARKCFYFYVIIMFAVKLARFTFIVSYGFFDYVTCFYHQ